MKNKKRASPVCCLAIADTHFWHNPPSARSEEANWLDAQDRHIQQLKALQKKYQPPIDGSLTHHKLPIVVAGDVFDRHSPTPECLNFLLGALPDEMYCVAGNHDLPNHLMGEFRKSGLCTLVKAGKMKLLKPRSAITPPGAPFVRLRGFSCGEEVLRLPRKDANALLLDIAVVHAYVWRKGFGFHGAAVSDVSSKWRKRLEGYDVAVFGDNHQPFLASKEGARPIILNAGCFIRRKSDERDIESSVWLIRQDGTVSRERLDGSQDKFLEPEELAKKIGEGEGMEEFVDELNNIADYAINFKEAVKQAIKTVKPRKRVASAILEAMEGMIK